MFITEYNDILELEKQNKKGFRDLDIENQPLHGTISNNRSKNHNEIYLLIDVRLEQLVCK